MDCLEAPLPLVEAIGAGLIAEDMRLGPSVMVRVAEQHRNDHGWPALMIAALVVASDMPRGVPAVWATGEVEGPIFSVYGAAREYSHWASLSTGGPVVRDLAARFPEAERARRCLPANE